MKKLRLTLHPEDKMLISYLLRTLGGTKEDYDNNPRLFLEEDLVLKRFRSLNVFKGFCHALSNHKTALKFSKIKINPSTLSQIQFAELLFNSTKEPLNDFEKAVYSQAMSEDALVYATRSNEYKILLDKKGVYEAL